MKNKGFDCVQMKNDIQRKIMDETEGMSEKEVSDYTVKKILANPILANVWSKARRIKVDKQFSNIKT